jgi:hypothetical protein
MTDLEREVKSEIEVAFFQERGRFPDSAEFRARFWSHPKIIAYQARRKVELLTAKAQWEKWQREGKV